LGATAGFTGRPRVLALGYEEAKVIAGALIGIGIGSRCIVFDLKLTSATRHHLAEERIGDFGRGKWIVLVYVTLRFDEIPQAIGELDHIERMRIAMGTPNRHRAAP